MPFCEACPVRFNCIAFAESENYPERLPTRDYEVKIALIALIYAVANSGSCDQEGGSRIPYDDGIDFLQCEHEHEPIISDICTALETDEFSGADITTQSVARADTE